MSVRARARLDYVVLFAAVGAFAPYMLVYDQSLGMDLAAVGVIGQAEPDVARRLPAAFGELAPRPVKWGGR